MAKDRDFGSRIVTLLTPHIGSFIAEMTLRSQCKALGISPEQISPADLPDLATKISAALAFQGHRAEASVIGNKIKGLR